MSRRDAALVIWVVVSFVIVMTALTAVLILISGDEYATLAIPVVVIPIVGGVILSRDSRNKIGRLMMAAGTIAVISGLLDAYARFAVTRQGWPGEQWAAWVSNWTFWYPLECYLVLLLLLFPTGRLLSPRWRAVVVLGMLYIAFAAAADMIEPGGYDAFSAYPDLQNPVGVPSLASITDMMPIFDLVLLVTIALAVVSIIVRFRRSRGIERQQLKWFVFVAIAVIAMFGAMVGSEALPEPAETIAMTAFGVSGLLGAIVGLPVAIAFAVLRYRLYDIDVIINRTIVYALVTTTLFVVYVTLVVSLQTLLESLTSGSDLIVAGSTLIVAALFRPLRARFQSIVDRRFYRRRYDAAQTLEAFSTRLRDEIDIASLSQELHAVLHDTMQPAHVSIWLRSPSGGGQP